MKEGSFLGCKTKLLCIYDKMLNLVKRHNEASNKCHTTPHEKIDDPFLVHQSFTLTI